MTLPELMVTSAIFSMAMAGFLALHIFALRYDQTVKLKVSACNDARNALNRIAGDIRSSGRIRLGSFDGSKFTEASFGQRQQGNAIEVYPIKSVTNNFVRYYCDTGDDLVKRQTSSGSEIVLARAVTNDVVFTAEDWGGQVLSNSFNNRVIGVTLQFYQDHDPGTNRAGGFLYDYYQVHTRVTRRALE